MSTSLDIYNQWSGRVYTYNVEVILLATPIKMEVSLNVLYLVMGYCDNNNDSCAI